MRPSTLVSVKDCTPQLREAMQRVGVTSFKSLSQLAGISEWQVSQLRRGQVANMRLSVIQKLCDALQLSWVQFVDLFSDPSSSLQPSPPSSDNHCSPVHPDLAAVQAECQQLQTQLAQQHFSLQTEFQQTCLQSLESWLRQWPTVVQAVQNNPDLPAVKVLPLVRPVEQLVQQWGVEAIAPIGTTVPYDPQWHQLQGSTDHQTPVGTPVRIRRTGYRHKENLLYRAEVTLEAHPLQTHSLEPHPTESHQHMD